jgi:hypothetical protein
MKDLNRSIYNEVLYTNKSIINKHYLGLKLSNFLSFYASIECTSIENESSRKKC